MSEYNDVLEKILDQELLIAQHNKDLFDLKEELKKIEREDKNESFQAAKKEFKDRLEQVLKNFLNAISVDFNHDRAHYRFGTSQSNRMTLGVSYEIFNIDGFKYFVKINLRKDSDSCDVKFFLETEDKDRFSSVSDIEFLFGDDPYIYYDESYCDRHKLVIHLKSKWRKFLDDIIDIVSQRREHSFLELEYLDKFIQSNFPKINP